MNIALQIRNIIGTGTVVFIIGFCTLILFSVRFMLDKWGSVTVDSLIYQLCTPMKGAGSSMFGSYLLRAALPSAGVAVGCLLLLVMLTSFGQGILLAALGLAAAYVIVTVACIKKTYLQLYAREYFAFDEEKSEVPVKDFVREHAVSPRAVELSFPEKKRNLICLYLESMETTMTTPQYGGACREDYIPELRKLAEEHVDFSEKTGKLNGAICYPGSTWTMGALFSGHTGLPLQATWKTRKRMCETFFPEITALDDLLAEQGYEQLAIMGSSVDFGAKRPFFRRHGGCKVYDYQWAQEHHVIPGKYNVWWGMEDARMYDMAKQILSETAEKDKPFFATIVTCDTHFPGGYHCEHCPDTHADPYGNVYACASRQAEAFIQWVTQQPFYENTTIAVFGDHPTMDHAFCKKLPKESRRNVYTVYIHPANQPKQKTARQFSVFDAFPTMLSSLGVKIEGDRLGLGTDLFSGRQTLTEELGEERMTKELRKRSRYMMEEGAR